MTQEWMLKTLVDLGFKQQDAEVYVFLALNGSQKAKAIADALKTYRRQVYRTLKELQNREIINATSNLPAQFSAIPFDKVLGLFIRANMEEADRIEEKKDEILALWKSTIKADSKG
jgi:sugar-specific transcriptional regulator TrmB